MPQPSKTTPSRHHSLDKSHVQRKSVSRTKVDTLIRCLQRPTGASLATLCRATCWQPHSIRSALSRLNDRGYRVARLQAKGRVTRYRLEGEPPHG